MMDDAITALPECLLVRHTPSHLTSHTRNPIFRATRLDMDHVFMNFYDFMWCGFFVIPPMILGALFGGPCSSGIFGLLKLKLFR